METWLRGDPLQPPPPAARLDGRNSGWRHLLAGDVISMPDKWGLSGSHTSWTWRYCIPLAMVDADFAKEQLLLLGREWYQHPNGQIPAYEWAFGDQPPVLAWSAWRVYKISTSASAGWAIRNFLEQVFPQADAQLHLVGQPQDAGEQHRWGAASCRLDIGVFVPARRYRSVGTSRAERRHQLGWRCSAWTCSR
ncbi:MAG: hypothetical protein U0841_18865 [Chloroflexia bacterium]